MTMAQNFGSVRSEHLLARHEIGDERREKISYFAVLFFLAICIPWLIVFAWLRDIAGTLNCVYIILSMLITLQLFRIKRSIMARMFWLINCNIFIIGALVFALPGEDIDLFFLVVLALPFLVFSQRRERQYLITTILLPIALWFLTFFFQLNGSSEWLLGIRLLETQMPQDVLNLAIRLTVGLILFMGIGVFAHLASQGESELYEASRDAERASRQKDDFLATMSHEIRTPMNGMIGMIEVLDTEQQSPEQSRAIGTVRNSAFSLLRIIDDILDANKINAGELNIEAARMELRPVLEGVVVTLQTMADDNNVSLALSIAPDVPELVFADSGRIRQIILNILSNAIKYTADDLTGRQGWVYVIVEKDKHQNLIIRIRDEGIGMSQELMDKLFQPFVQGDMTSMRRVSGTGLGLVITKQLVQQMHGTILTTSKEGVGTTVEVTLPLPIVPEFPKRDDRFENLEIVYVRDQSCVSVWQQTDILQSLGARLLDTPIWMDGELMLPDTKPGTVFIMHAREDAKLEEWQRQIRIDCENPKIIAFTSIRSEKIGRIEDDLYRVQLFPILQSELYSALEGLLSTPEVRSRKVIDTNLRECTEQQKERRAKVKLLLVEDNEINQVVLLKQLEVLGYNADVAHNGEEGLALWKSKDYEIILTDCNMPLMDGFEMTRQGRSWEAANGRERLPVIAITANALTGDADKCFDAGMDDYLAKPIEIKSLEDKIVNVIGV